MKTVDQNIATVPKHPIPQRWPLSSSKIVRTTNTRYTHSLQASVSPEWQRHTSKAEQQAQTTEENVEISYNSKARSLPEINIGSKVAVQNHETKRWDIYGIVTDIGHTDAISSRLRVAES